MILLYFLINLAENQEEWKVYQMWCMLPENVKNCWIEAGKTINSYDEFAKTIPNKVSLLFCVLSNISFTYIK